MVDFHQKGQVLFIDDEMHIRLSCSQTLELAGFDVIAHEKAQEGLKTIKSGWEGIIISDVKMPDMDGLDLLEKIRDVAPDLPVILITGHGDVSMAVHALKTGAYDFLEKPFASDRLIEVAERAMEKHHLISENKRLRQKLESGDKINATLFGKSAPMERLRTIIKSIAPSEADVLIIGETGTGKELVARSLHDHSKRRHGKFVGVNCGAMPEAIFESELFGHEPGAFPNVSTRRIGKIEYASQGTLFLDEIEALPLEMQIKLLRVLQERSIERLGANEEIDLDLRVIAASKVDLLERVQNGEFREDLYYRLSVVQIETPPLRDCLDDLPYLFQIFCEDSAHRAEREVPQVSTDSLRELMAHDWPGNIRELKNRAERFVLSPQIKASENQEELDAKSLPDKMEAFEKSLIRQALIETGGSIKDSMELLAIPRKTLTDKIKKHGLIRQDYVMQKSK